MVTSALVNPFPEHSHDTCPIQIGIGPRDRSRTSAGRADIQRRVAVNAYSTCNEYLFVHPTYPNHDAHEDVIASGWVTDWSVSHAPTGATIMTGIPDMRTAMYLAGAVSKVIWWGMRNGGDNGAAHITDYQRVFGTLPGAVREWILSWGYRD